MPERVEQRVRKVWLPDKLDVHPAIERQKDGTIVVSSVTENLSFDAKFWFAFVLYHLEAENDDSGGDE